VDGEEEEELLDFEAVAEGSESGDSEDPGGKVYRPASTEHAL